jgi:hypothetical protein
MRRLVLLTYGSLHKVLHCIPVGTWSSVNLSVEYEMRRLVLPTAPSPTTTHCIPNIHLTLAGCCAGLQKPLKKLSIPVPKRRIQWFKQNCFRCNTSFQQQNIFSVCYLCIISILSAFLQATFGWHAVTSCYGYLIRNRLGKFNIKISTMLQFLSFQCILYIR